MPSRSVPCCRSGHFSRHHWLHRNLTTAQLARISHRGLWERRFPLAEVLSWGGLDPDGIKRCPHSAWKLGRGCFVGARSGFSPKTNAFRLRPSLLQQSLRSYFNCGLLFRSSSQLNRWPQVLVHLSEQLL